MNKKCTEEEVKQHYERLENAKEAASPFLTNWQEKEKLARQLSVEASVERSKAFSSQGKYFTYPIAYSCLEYVIERSVVEESKCKGIIYAIATKHGYELEEIDWAYHRGCQNTKATREYLLSQFPKINKLIRYTSLRKTDINYKNANTLPKLLKAIIRANKEFAMKEENKRLQREKKELEAKLLKLADKSKSNAIEIARLMKDQGYSNVEIAKHLGVSDRTIRRWLNV